MDPSVFEACLDLIKDRDNLMLMKCISEHLQVVTQRNANATSTWLLILCGALVFFMQAGFAMLCAGSVRDKNTQNTMLKNLLDACGAAMAFFTIGYAFSFGETRDGATTTFIGTSNFLGMGDIDMSFYFFQFTFSAAAATIVAGTLAERCRMIAYICYSLILTGFVYPIVVHAVWSNTGFLSVKNDNPLLGIGMIDFSGSGVVHMTGGATALFATYILGPRRGRFYDVETGEPLEKPAPMPGHSVSLQVLGIFVLIFGWFGFIPGSALLLDNSNPHKADVGALAAVNTFLGCSAGTIAALSIKTFTRYRATGMFLFDLLGAMNGSLSGLVAITAGAATVEPWAAIVIGFTAGIIYLWASQLLIKLKLDDAVDAIPVHLFNGLWGVIAVGLFSSPRLLLQAYGTDEHPGFFYSLGKDTSDGAIHVSGNLLACQVIGALCIMAWTFVLMHPFFYFLNYMGWFRSEFEEELIGLDVTYGIVGDVYDEGKKEQYLDAVERYKKRMREKQFENQLMEFDEEALKRILRVSIKKRSRASSHAPPSCVVRTNDADKAGKTELTPVTDDENSGSSDFASAEEVIISHAAASLGSCRI